MPADIVVDSGPIIALFDLGDPYHERAKQFVRGSQRTLISTIAVLTEAMYVLQRNLTARKNLLDWVQRGAVALRDPTVSDFPRIAELLEKYADLPMDFTDAVVVALCERLGTNRVASVDRDFSIYRFKGRTKFVNVFFP